MHPILKASRKILTFKYYDKFAFIQIRDSMGAHLIFFIIFPLFSCIILTNQSLPWYSLRSGFQCDTNMAAVFSGMRPPAFSNRFHKQYRSPVTMVTLRQTNQPSVTEGLPHLSPDYIMLIRPQQTLPLARIVLQLCIFKNTLKTYGIHAAIRDSH